MGPSGSTTLPASSKVQRPATSLSAHQETLMLQEIKKSCTLVAPTTPQWKGEPQSPEGDSLLNELSLQ